MVRAPFVGARCTSFGGDSKMTVPSPGLLSLKPRDCDVWPLAFVRRFVGFVFFRSLFCWARFCVCYVFEGPSCVDRERSGGGAGRRGALRRRRPPALSFVL